MGAPKHKWRCEEREALVAGVAKHGAGKWTTILKDPQFSHSLAARTNIDLKDKWRNISVSASGQGPRYKFRSPKLKALSSPPVANSNAPSSLPVAQFKSPKLKALPAAPVANSNASSSLPVAQIKSPELKALLAPPVANSNASSSLPVAQIKSPELKALLAPPVANSNATSSLPAAQDATADVAMDPSNSPVDRKTAPRYNALIFEAISRSKDPNGSDISAIISFIEQRTEVPPNFRRVLSSKLRRFVNQGKLEKVQNSYRIQKNGASGQKIPSTPKPKDDQHVKQSQTPPARTLDDEIEEALKHTAYLIADAENKSFLALEAVKEAEWFAKMVEEAEAMHLFAQEILERSNADSGGEVVSMA